MKKNLNHVALTIALFFSFVAYSYGQGIQPGSEKKVVCINMPKCGSHLLNKCISLFGDPRLQTAYDTLEAIKPTRSFVVLYDSFKDKQPPMHFTGRFDPRTMGPISWILKGQLNSKKGFIWSHWPYTPEAEKYINLKSRANFFIIRDPRAMLVSMAFMVSKGYQGEEADPLPIMLDFIDGRQKSFVPWGVTVNEAYPLLWEYGIVGFYKMYLPWMQAKNFYTVRFENLVGARGGGSDLAQHEEICNIAKHIGITLSEEKIKQVVVDLFGGSNTFREGQVDGWKKHFTPEMKKLFKNVPGANQLLIDLKYEKNADW